MLGAGTLSPPQPPAAGMCSSRASADTPTLQDRPPPSLMAPVGQTVQAASLWPKGKWGRGSPTPFLGRPVPKGPHSVPASRDTELKVGASSIIVTQGPCTVVGGVWRVRS